MPDPESLLTFFGTGTGAGVIIAVLLMTGWLVTKQRHAEMREERDAWRTAYEREHAAREDDRRSLVRAEQRSDTATEQGRMVYALLTALGHHGGVTGPPGQGGGMT